MLMLLPIMLCVVVDFGRLPMAMSDLSKNTQVEFYGQVVDARGLPVQGAKVRAVVTGYNPFYAFRFARTREWDRPVEAVTDAQGRFSIRGFMGDGLGILSIDKQGYSWLYGTLAENDDNQSYSYNSEGPSYVPDRDRPAIFPLIRPGERTTVLPSRGGWQRHSDGTRTPNHAVVPYAPSVTDALPAEKK